MRTDPLQDEASHPRFRQDLVDERPVVWRELAERQSQLLGNGELRCHRRGEVILQGVRIERLRGACRRRGRWLQPEVVTRQGRQRQRELIGHVTDTVGTLLALAALEGAVPMEGNRAGHWGVWAGTLTLILDVQD